MTNYSGVYTLSETPTTDGQFSISNNSISISAYDQSHNLLSILDTGSLPIITSIICESNGILNVYTYYGGSCSINNHILTFPCQLNVINGSFSENTDIYITINTQI